MCVDDLHKMYSKVGYDTNTDAYGALSYSFIYTHTYIYIDI